MSPSSLEHDVAQFLESHCDFGRPVLLGLSGGPDSLALLYLLLPYVKARQLKLHVAYVDHGWRPDSADEAEQLSRLATQLGLPHHSIRLTNPPTSGNLEALSRQARLQFFASVCEQYHCQAVLLGHQADDVVETTLKRILEGATLPYLNGLQLVTSMDRITLWRPLVNVTKQQILNWLRQKGLTFFQDTTNQDPRFLRARMRSELFPMLSRQFGKNVQTGLRRIADEAQELRQYMDARIAPWLRQLAVGPMGLMLPLEHGLPDSSYELRYLVRRVIERAGLFVSREMLDDFVRAIATNVADQRATMGQRTLVVDRRRFFVLFRNLALPSAPVALPLGAIQWGPWEITLEQIPTLGTGLVGLKQVWQGHISLCLTGGNYCVGRPTASARLDRGTQSSTLGRHWSNHKVPAFLRDQVPVVWDNQRRVCVEFLTESSHQPPPEGPHVRVSCRLMPNPPYATIP